jgi:FixJ family two-component response regulator
MSETPVIAIVDDDGSIREATSSLLRSLGYRAAPFASARDFLESDALPEASCVVTDIKMPDISGFGLQRRMAERGHTPPVIFVTAFSEENYRRRAFDAGALGFFAKPFDEALLIECLERALGDRARPNETG